MVEVLSLLSDDVETDDAVPGENLKLRLKGIEEEEILPGFILCNAENLCHSGRTFDAQVSPVPSATLLDSESITLTFMMMVTTAIVITIKKIDLLGSHLDIL